VHHRARTHDAGFKGDVKSRIEQTIVLQYQPALTKRHNFGVRGRIVAANGAVPPFANHLIMMNQHRAHGHFALIPGTLSQR